MSVRVRVKISGGVNGVGFRNSLRRIAALYRVKGWVRNARGGTVEAVEGDTKDVEKVIEFCKKGPPAAYVERVQVLQEPRNEEFEDFEIRDD